MTWGGALALDEPALSLVLLSEPSLPDLILAQARESQTLLAAVEDKQAAIIVDAYKQAREQIASRLNYVWERSFGAGGNPEPKDLIEWARGQELLGQIDAHLDQLGVTTQALQGQAFSAGAALGFQQANIELGMAASDFGGAGILGQAVFGNLDTLTVDLGMTAAINETQNLSDTLRAEVHSQLTQGAIQGEGIRDIQRRVDGVLGGETVPAGNRAELISRWATIKGYNAAADQAIYDASQVIEGLQEMWLVELDDLTCPDCLAHEGEVRDPEDEFDQGRSFNNTPIKVYGGSLEYPPLHPRCRCTITAWHPRWAGIATLPPEDLQAGAQVFAQEVGFAPKSFEPPVPPPAGSLRATRAGRQVIRAQAIASIPDAVRAKTLEKYLGCWSGGEL